MTDSEILIVQSKVKDYIRGKSEMNTSGGVAVRLSQVIKQLCDRAIENAKTEGRKTVMDRDIPPLA